jgi:TatD DNase family protein
MTLIDTHSHIYLPEFDNDRIEMLERAEIEGVKKILLPAIDSSTHNKMLLTEEQFPGLCRSMIGLHPCSVKSDFKKELQFVQDYLEKKKFIAMGETGLDFYWDLSFKDQQYEAFEQQIKWARQYVIPVVIHSRNSIDECIDVIEKNQNGKLKGVFHCFSGNPDQAKRIIDLNFYLGIGGILTFNNSGLDKVISNIDLNNIILETDAPYLAPVPFRGKRNECSYLKYILQKLAEVKQKEAGEIATVTTANAKKLFESL